MKNKNRKNKVSITVSGLSGSGKSYIANFLARRLNLEHKSAGDIFRKIAKKERKSLEEFCRNRSEEIDLITDKETERLLKKGNVVIDGRLSGYVATKLLEKGKLNNCFRIFVRCPINIRAKRVAKRDGIAIKEAKMKIKERDKSDLDKYEKIYSVNPCDKRFYDLFIDNSINKKELNKILERISSIIEDFIENKI